MQGWDGERGDGERGGGGEGSSGLLVILHIRFGPKFKDRFTQLLTPHANCNVQRNVAGKTEQLLVLVN